jgi:hypothetical protein
VGAGKTFEMAPPLWNQSASVSVRNRFSPSPPLDGAVASEFLRLYPSQISFGTKKDFESKNRKKFLCPYRTGDFDAVSSGTRN